MKSIFPQITVQKATIQSLNQELDVTILEYGPS